MPAFADLLQKTGLEARFALWPLRRFSCAESAVSDVLRQGRYTLLIEER
jgi:hypothetical protein